MSFNFFSNKGRPNKGRPLFIAAALFAVSGGYAIYKFFPASHKNSPSQSVNSEDGVAAVAAAEVVKSNVGIKFEVTKNSEASTFGHRVVDAKISLKDVTSGEALSGKRVMAWMSLEDDAKPLSESACKEAIKSRLAGGLAAQSGVNLNQWNLFTMNDDNTLSVINPQVSFSKTKLRQLISLTGYPVDWVLSADGAKLFVTIPKRGMVSVIDTLKGKIEKNINLGGKPVRARSGSGVVLVGNDDDDVVHLIDSASEEVVGSFDVGDGHKEIAISPDGRQAMVVAADENEILNIDLLTRKEVARSSLPAGIVSMVYSSQGTVFAVNERLGRVYVSENGKFIDKRYFESGAGSAVAAVSGNGRWLFVANPRDGKVEIINGATLERRYTVRGLVTPDQIHMSDDYAYLRSAGKPGVALVRIDSLDREGQPAVSEVQVGTLPPYRSSDRGIAPAMMLNPEGGGMVIANPADKTIYFYQEGMMAPAGTIKNYGREPRGVMIADWSIRERGAGTYQTRSMLSAGGRYDAFVLLNEPRIGACLKIDIPSGLAMPGLVVDTPRELQLKTSWSEKTRLVVGEKATMDFTVTLKEGGKETRQLESESIAVRAFVPPVGPAEDLKARKHGNGFAVDFTPTTEGQLTLLIGSPSLGIDFTRRASVTVGVKSQKNISGARGKDVSKPL